MMLALGNRIREMLTLHTNPHAVHRRFTLKDGYGHQFWNRPFHELNERTEIIIGLCYRQPSNNDVWRFKWSNSTRIIVILLNHLCLDLLDISLTISELSLFPIWFHVPKSSLIFTCTTKHCNRASCWDLYCRKLPSERINIVLVLTQLHTENTQFDT